MTKRAVALTSLPKAAYFYDEKLKQKLLPPLIPPPEGDRGLFPHGRELRMAPLRLIVHFKRVEDFEQ